MATRCANHPGARAVFQCRECRRMLCPACTNVRDVGTARVRICAACSGAAELLHPDDLTFSALAGETLSALFSKHGAIVLAAGGLICGLLSTAMAYNIIPFINLIAIAVLWCIFAAYVCMVINRVSNGEFEMPMVGDVADFWDDLLLPGVRLLLANLTVVAPVAIYLVWFKTWHLNPRSTPQAVLADLLDPLLLVFGLVGLLYMPMATLVAAIQRSALAALNPLLVITLIFRALGGYLLALLLFYGVLLAGGVLGAIVGAVFARSGQVFLPKALGWAIDFLVWFLAASTLGGLAFKFGERYGLAPVRRASHLRADISHLPQVAGAAAATPTPAAGEPRPAPTPAAPSEDLAQPAVATQDPFAPPAQPRAPIELDSVPLQELSAPEAGMPLASVDSPAARPPAAPAPAASPRAVADPSALLAVGDLDGACDAYLAQLQLDPRAALPADALMAVAERLQARGQFAEAVEAFRKLGALYAGHPRAPDALLQAAFVSFRQLGRREDAVMILEFLLSRFSGAPAAAQARQILAALGPQG